MATLAELMDQLRQDVPMDEQTATEDPRKKGIKDILALAGRAPASDPLVEPMATPPSAIPAVLSLAKEESKTTTEEPTKIAALRSEVASQQKAAKEALALYSAKLAAQAAQKPPVPELSSEMPMTLQAYEEARKNIQHLKEKPPHDLLAEAALAILPTIAGYGLGRAVGGVGMAESGIAAGAGAGLTGIQEMQKRAEEDRNTKLALAYKFEMDRAQDIAKTERLKKEAEAKMASAYQVKSLEAQYPFLKKAGIEDMPEYMAYQQAKAGLERAQANLYATLGKGKKTDIEVQQQQEKVNPAKLQGNAEFKALPEERQIQIKDLAKKMADSRSVSVAMNANLAVLKDPRVSFDQKVKAGESMYKLLNMKDGTGRDAVGREEATRIGEFLKYKIGNITGVGSFIGRDLPEFIKQVELSVGAANSTVNGLQSQINQLYGRTQTPSSQGSSVADDQKQLDELDRKIKELESQGKGK